MNENLHDIDKLFRDGIDGHEEPVPPGVWEGVSNDLDKKQALYYKEKYNRLKRWGLLLLVLGGLTTAYIVIKVGANRDAEVAKVKSRPFVQDTDRTNANDSREKKNNHESLHDNYSVNNNPSQETNNIAEKTDDLKTEKPNGDTTAATPKNLQPNITNNRREVLAKENKAQVDGFSNGNEKQHETQTKESQVREKEKITTKKSSGTPLLTINSKRIKSKGQPLAKQLPHVASKNQSQSPLHPYSKPIVEPTRSLSHNLLAVTNRNTPVINLPPVQADTKTILPETTAVLPSKAKSSTARGFSLTAFVSPNFSFDRLEDDKRLSGPGRNRRDANNEESGNVSFSGGVLLNYGLSQKLTLQSGVTITSSTTSIAPKTVYAKADNNGRTRYELNCSSGYSYIETKNGVQPAVGDSAKTSGSKSKLTYVSIPASLSLQISKGRFSFYPGIGAGLNFLTSGKTETQLAGENSVSNIRGLKSSYLDGRISLGAEYNLTPKISIGLRPTARIALTPINKETPVKSYQNYLNIETGVRIKL